VAPPSPTPVQTPPTTDQNGAKNVVTFDGTGFVPSVLTVQKGETVTFKNGSTQDMRVASNPHPIHNGYPTTGGCVGSTFDSCAMIPAGGSWSFTFDFVGSWGYHDHLNPSITATIVVQP
jgi:plastocyanin